MQIIVFGVGQLSEVISYYLEQDPAVNVAGYTVDRAFIPDTGKFLDKPVAAWEDISQHFPPDQYQLLGPISYYDNNRLRKQRYLEGKALGYSFASYVHPSSHIGGAQIGENSVVLEECTVQPFAILGVCSILWSKVHIGHHTQVSDYCFFASFCGVAGNARIGERVFFGGQTGLVDNTTVGDGCIVAAGTIITKNLPANSFATTQKARVLADAADRFANKLLINRL
ncbi:acetyltransferase [Sulfitobacter guttiformis]|uniref:Succinyltransferase-like protein n=1 Tax=Sulfitobacter guttiformis TaxID=74349 RepID=A0A420DIX3_9RHOB|nr:acetyltransferase [Sulfitobacter guttiformis]RKE94183.1 succinyltransferase-like protein [Sulfitobacter guttiformis]